MSASNRDPSIRVTLGYEGGYTNNPHDPGGPTNFGITLADAQKHWKPTATAEDMKAMPISVAIDIYRKHYWAPLRCDDDPPGVDCVTHDYGVNSGIGRAGPVRDRLKQSDVTAWIKAICAERLSFLEHLKTWKWFGRGWGPRVANVEAQGVRMHLEGRGLRSTEAAPRMQEHAKTHQGKALANGGAVIASSGSLMLLHGHLALVAGTLLSVPLIAFLIWEAVHHFHRAKAYAAHG